MTELAADDQGDLAAAGKVLMGPTVELALAVDLVHTGETNLTEVVDDIETALDVMGPNHIGLGSDHYGANLAPEGLEHIGKVPAITEELVRGGHSDETIRKFLGENYLRVFEEVWGE